MIAIVNSLFRPHVEIVQAQKHEESVEGIALIDGVEQEVITK